MEDSFARIQALHEEIRNSKEYKVIQDIRENDTSIGLFLRNYRELKRLLDKTEDLSTAIKLGDKGKQDIHRIVIEEITFLLHNYVSSAMSLVKHTNRLHQRIYGNTDPERLKEIQKEIKKRFANNETHRIIQGIRDYTQHRKLPVVGKGIYYYALGNTPELEAEYYISTESLLEWDGWTALAKRKLNKLKNLSIEERFIEHQKKDISINKLATDYHKEVMSFYEWLGNRQKEWHKEDNRKLKEKIKMVEQLEKQDSDEG